MDALAKSIAFKAIISNNLQPPSFHSPLGFGSIMCYSTPVSSCLQQDLYHTISHHNYINCVSKLFELHPDVFRSLVNWDCYRLSRSHCRFGLFMFITKFISENIASGKVMVQRKQRASSNCPRCHSPDEDNLHILTCSSASTFRSTLVVQLQLWLHSQQTDPVITSFLIKGLQQWFVSPTSQNQFNSSDILHDSALHSQSRLGWYTFLCGYISSDLIKAQEVFYLETGSRRSALRWGSNLASQAWNITYQLWVHRNEALHDSNTIHILSGLAQLHTSISFEYNTGVLHLPSVYRRYFSTPLPIILKKSVTYKKRWFLVIRSARESCGISTYDDIWHHDQASRRWIGLCPSHHNHSL